MYRAGVSKKKNIHANFVFILIEDFYFDRRLESIIKYVLSQNILGIFLFP